MHSPTDRDRSPGRESGVAISISDPERIRRLDAVDEMKRVLDMAEHVPFQFLDPAYRAWTAVGRPAQARRRLQLARKSGRCSPKQRGVTIALENTPNELGAPESLQKFIRDTHLHDLKPCFDIGHAHIGEGVAAGFERCAIAW